MKIFAIGMNYAAHNQELHGTLKRPDEPVIFTKADSAILNQGKPFFIPDHLGRIDYETEVVVRICRLGKNIPERFAHRYYDALTVGSSSISSVSTSIWISTGRPFRRVVPRICSIGWMRSSPISRSSLR